MAGGKTEAAGNWRAASLEGLNHGLRAKHGTVSPRSKQTLLAIFEGGDPAVRHAALTNLEAAGLPEGNAANLPSPVLRLSRKMSMQTRRFELIPSVCSRSRIRIRERTCSNR